MTFTVSSTFDNERYRAGMDDDGLVRLNKASSDLLSFAYAMDPDDMGTMTVPLPGGQGSYTPTKADDPVAIFLWCIQLCPGAYKTVGTPPAGVPEATDDLARSDGEELADMTSVRGTLLPAQRSTTTERKVLPMNRVTKPHDGAMIALVPSEDSARKLHIADGTDLDELHCTLMYLGEGASFSEGQRDLIRALVGTMLMPPPIEANVSGAASLGDGGATVYLIGDSDRLADFFRDVVMVVGGWAVERHTGELEKVRNPWIAHVTAGENMSVNSLAYRGPVVFDRVRVAFEGIVTDWWLHDDEDGPVAADMDDELAEDAFVKAMRRVRVAPAGSDDDELDHELEHLGKVKTVSVVKDALGLIEGKDYGSADPRAARLRAYWTKGKGAAKIRWGEPGDFMRCVRQLRKYVGARAEGLAAIYHKAALGVWPGREGGKKVLSTAPEVAWADNKVIRELATTSLTDTIHPSIANPVVSEGDRS